MVHVDDPYVIEMCVIKRLKKYQVRNNSSYFECSYNQLIGEVAECVNFFENKIIDRTHVMPANILSRSKKEFDENAIMTIKILDDDSDESQMADIGPKNEQYGGADDRDYMQYLVAKLNYLELKYEFLFKNIF